MSDVLKIATIPGLEPEEQPVTREVDVSINVRGSITGETLGALGSQVAITETALDFAQNLKRICVNCKHFDRPKALEVFQEAIKTSDGRAELGNLRARLLDSDNLSATPDEVFTVDSELAQLGVCRAISEITKSDVIVHPLGHCPVETYGDNFRPIDRAASKRGDAGYDQIMQQAAGKIVL